MRRGASLPLTIITAASAVIALVLPAASAAAATSCCTVTINGPSVTMNITTAGHQARRTFAGQAGQRVAEVLTSPVTSNDGCSTLTVIAPNGTTVDSNVNCGNGNAVGAGPDDLTITGTYTVVLRLDTGATGHGTLWVSAPVTIGTAAINGPSQTMNVGRVGQGVQRTFTAKTGQRLTVVVTNPVTSNGGCTTVTVSDPSGATFGSNVNCGNGNAVGIGPTPVTVSGTYSVRVEVDTVATGTATLWLSKPVTVGTITVNGSAGAMKVQRVGQGVIRTFSGTAGEQVTSIIRSLVSSDDGCGTLTLIAPGQVQVDSNVNCGNGNTVTMGPDTLPSTGTYRVLFEVNNVATGSGSLKVTAP